jgi:hypothetical protein
VHVVADDFDEQLGVPTTNRDQSCAFCGRSQPRFAHRLDPTNVRFQVYGKGWTLPTFWTVCVGCEELVAGGDDRKLLEVMRREESDRHLRKASLAAFRAADLGALPLRDA